MGIKYEFPNKGQAYIRRGLLAYDSFDFESTTNNFRKAMAEYPNLHAFQDNMLDILEESGFFAEIIQIIVGIAESGEEPDRIMQLVDSYDDSDFEIFESIEETCGINELPDYIENLIVFGSETDSEDNQAKVSLKDTANAMAAIEMTEELLENQSHFTPHQQLELLDKVVALPEKLKFTLLLDLIQGNEDYIFQTDLIHALKDIIDEETIIEIPDINGKMRKIDINGLPLVLKHDFYQAGLEVINDRFFRDPVICEFLRNEWILICSYVYPFFDVLNDSPVTLVTELFDIISGNVKDGKTYVIFNQLHKIRSKILHSQYDY